MQKYDISDIIEMLPHRYPFLLIDRVVEVSEDNKRLVALKNVTVNEPQFTGHFPEVPVMPGVLLIEAMAQASAILALRSLPEGVDKKNSLFYFAGIDKARFKRVVQPGDQVRLESNFVRQKMGMGIFDVVATVDSKVVAQAQLMCAYRPVPSQQK